MIITSVTGLPWYVSATVISLAHMDSLRKESTTSAPGEQPEFLGIRYGLSSPPTAPPFRVAPVSLLPVAAAPGDRQVPTAVSRAGTTPQLWGCSCVQGEAPDPPRMGSQQCLVRLGGCVMLPKAQGHCCVPPPRAATTSKNEKASAGTPWKPGHCCAWGPGRGCGCLREPRASCDACATACREQRLTGLAVFVLTGVSVFMAPILKVWEAASGFGLQVVFASFLKLVRSGCIQQGQGRGLVVPKPDTPPAAAPSIWSSWRRET